MDYFTADVRRIQAIAPGQQVIELVADERIARLLRNRKIRHVRVGVEDGRSITPLQQRKAYATLRDIGEHTGYPMEDIKEIMKVEHMMRTGDYEHFSLSDCSMTKAREFINTLLEYALKEGIILDESGLMRTDDIDTYLIQCIRYRRCCICGRPADIHHVDAIGMGNNRRHYDDSQNEEEVMAISFETIGNGALAAQFRQALAQVGRNIIDPNMDPEAVRGITIKLKFKPNESGTIETIYACEAKLAGPKKSKTTFLIGQDVRTGKIEMSEYGNNRPQVAAYDTIQTAPRQQAETEKNFDPETGEIYEPQSGPIDLRKKKGE